MQGTWPVPVFKSRWLRLNHATKRQNQYRRKFIRLYPYQRVQLQRISELIFQVFGKVQEVMSIQAIQMERKI